MGWYGPQGDCGCCQCVDVCEAFQDSKAPCEITLTVEGVPASGCDCGVINDAWTVQLVNCQGSGSGIGAFYTAYYEAYFPNVFWPGRSCGPLPLEDCTELPDGLGYTGANDEGECWTLLVRFRVVFAATGTTIGGVPYSIRTMDAIFGDPGGTNHMTWKKYEQAPRGTWGAFDGFATHTLPYLSRTIPWNAYCSVPTGSTVTAEA